jgi:hypothetical protein
MRNFALFADKVKKKLESFSDSELFLVSDENDDIYNHYLASFPEGQNPIMSERTEHDCSCCKQFIRNIGSVVSIKDGIKDSVWNIEGLEYPYDVVAKSLKDKIDELPVISSFFSDQKKHGNKETVRLLDGQTITNNHFYCSLHSKYVSDSVASKKGSRNSLKDTLSRALTDLSVDSVDSVLDLIEQGNLYRGDEFKQNLISFKKLLRDYQDLGNKDPELFFWEKSSDFAVSKIRNSVIGTLLVDLSNGVSLEKALKKYEVKVAPSNYKRPKSLITKAMINQANKTIEELGIRGSLDRRYAKVSDVSPNDVIFVDRDVKPLMKDSLTESLLSEVKPKKFKEKDAKDIKVEDFIKDVLPKSTKVEIMVNNSQKKNFVSITAPINEDAKNIFKWDNNFAWSYDGNIADSSIKDKVRSAGGNVTAPLRFSLAWFNSDDLDIHVKEPSGNNISFSNKRSPSGGFLDVDMNAGGPSSRTPVENVCWQKPKDGTYIVSVNNYSKRESIDFGFELEVESNGNISNFSYPVSLANKKTIKALSVVVKNGSVESIKNHKDILAYSSPQEHWGIKTQEFVRVDMIMNSPNYWDKNQVGNKHLFFIIDKCKNPDSTRGIYNEFLSGDLNQHRKVFEIIGEKTKCEFSEEQLSGLGFSSTKRDKVIIKCSGEQNRIYNVIF